MKPIRLDVCFQAQRRNKRVNEREMSLQAAEDHMLFKLE